MQWLHSTVKIYCWTPQSEASDRLRSKSGVVFRASIAPKRQGCFEFLPRHLEVAVNDDIRTAGMGSGASSDAPVRRKERRGFASMSPEKQREIASKGGRAAHLKGTAHEWTSEEARSAGRKGGMISRGGRGRLTAGEDETSDAS
jgi:general stress protein YciG